MAGMTYIRKLVVALAAVCALSAEAGLVYHYSVEPGKSGARVWIDGDRKRVELDPDPENPRPYDVEIRANGETTFINLQNKTYYRPPKGPAKGGNRYRAMENVKLVGKPTITRHIPELGPQALGRDTIKHVIEFRYRIRGDWTGTSVGQHFETVITVLAAPSLPRDRDVALPRTEFSEIDDEVAKFYASLVGMIVRHETLDSEGFEDGPTYTSSQVRTIDELKEGPIGESVFQLPKGLTYQEPVIAGPGS